MNLNSTERHNHNNYVLHQDIACREVSGEYLIFSGLSRQTLIVHPYAFDLVQLLKGRSCSYDEILDALCEASVDFKDDDLADFVSTSIEQLIDFGILDQSGV